MKNIFLGFDLFHIGSMEDYLGSMWYAVMCAELAIWQDYGWQNGIQFF